MTDGSVLCSVNIDEGTVPPGACRCGTIGPIRSLVGQTKDASGKIICYWANIYYCWSPCDPPCINGPIIGGPPPVVIG